MCDGVLHKPQIKGETKLSSAVRGWNAWMIIRRLPLWSCSQWSVVPLSFHLPLYERRIKREAKFAVCL